MMLNDILFHGDHMSVELWYPNYSATDEGQGKIRAIHVGLMHVRAADDIRIEYDFERDGWSIKQASIFEWAGDDDVMDSDWQEVAFVKAWARQRCGFKFPTGDRCEDRTGDDHEHWLSNLARTPPT